MARTTSYSGKGAITVSVNFAPLLEKINKAGGDVEAATWEAARKGARVMREELVAQAEASGVPSYIANEVTFKAERDDSGNRYACTVGWRKGEYDPNNPSNAYKALFMNYGTPHRYTKSGANRGYVTGRGFIGRAKRKARPKIKKVQEEALSEILKGLKE